MNILIPSVGKKRYLVQALSRALRRRGGKLLGSDLCPDALGLQAVDEVVPLPPFGSQEYWPVADAVIREHRIGAVIPVRDAELAEWARRAEADDISARVFLSTSRTLAACYDKSVLYRKAAEAGVQCPPWRLLLEGRVEGPDIRFPALLKPRYGAGARGVHRVERREELAMAIRGQEGDLMLQRLVAGQEYSVDCYALADHSLAACCVRERRVVVDGQSVAGERVEAPEMVAACRRLAEVLEFRGVINVQFISGDEGPMLIDLNPRFPGGIALTEAGDGPCFTDWVVRELVGEPLPDWSPSLDSLTTNREG